jgi:K+ transporter
MEQPLLLPVLNELAKATGIPLNSPDTTFYFGYENIVVQGQATINRIPEAIFSYFHRNAVHEEEQYGMPLDQVVEIGAQLRV